MRIDHPPALPERLGYLIDGEEYQSHLSMMITPTRIA
jgi:hypothetical protein